VHKRIISIILGLCLTVSLTACKKDDEDSKNTDETQQITIAEETTVNPIDNMEVADILAAEEENINYNESYFSDFLKSIDYALDMKQYFPEIASDELYDYLALNYSRSFCENIRQFLEIESIELVQAKDVDIYCLVYTEYKTFNVHFRVNEIALTSVTEMKG
jgi:hypothetical protein